MQYGVESSEELLQLGSYSMYRYSRPNDQSILTAVITRQSRNIHLPPILQNCLHLLPPTRPHIFRRA